MFLFLSCLPFSCVVLYTLENRYNQPIRALPLVDFTNLRKVGWWGVHEDAFRNLKAIIQTIFMMLLLILLSQSFHREYWNNKYHCYLFYLQTIYPAINSIFLDGMLDIFYIPRTFYPSFAEKRPMEICSFSSVKKDVYVSMISIFTVRNIEPSLGHRQIGRFQSCQVGQLMTKFCLPS